MEDELDGQLKVLKEGGVLEENEVAELCARVRKAVCKTSVT